MMSHSQSIKIIIADGSICLVHLPANKDLGAVLTFTSRIRDHTDMRSATEHEGLKVPHEINYFNDFDTERF